MQTASKHAVSINGVVSIQRSCCTFHFEYPMARRHQSSRPACRMSAPTSLIFSTRTTPEPGNDACSKSALRILRSASASPVEWSASVQEAHLKDWKEEVDSVSK